MGIFLMVLFLGCFFWPTASFFFPTSDKNPDKYKGKVVGVLAQQTFGYHYKLGDEYLAASYVKFVQSAGAQVVPVLTFWEDKKIADLLGKYERIYGQINGVLLPGGTQDIPNSRYHEVVKLIYHWAEDYNAEHRSAPFTIWGTCFGMQSVLTVAANSNILSNCSADGVRNNLTLRDMAQQSKLLSGLSEEQYKAIQTELLVFNSHDNCVTVDSFSTHLQEKSPMAGKFNLLAVNWDKNGHEYVALAEHVEFPYFVSQFHPEKIAFEWNPVLDIPHSQNSVAFSQYLANGFITYVNANGNSFVNAEDFYKLNIENFDAVYTLRTMNLPLQSCYFFKNHNFD